MGAEPVTTVDPDRFDEAMEEFLSRRIVSRDEADQIADYAKRRAWWISGVAQMDVVRDVHESLTRAMESGIPFEEWRDEVEEKLTAAWGRPNSHRIETIFRNATMQAANAGRWRQMHEPHVLAVRPFLQFDAVRDSVRCSICSACAGVVLTADHPWWQTHAPILHHACRCSVVSLRRETAEGKGITVSPPGVLAAKGFGVPPDLAEPPKPWQEDKPPPPDMEHTLAVKTAEHEAAATHPTVEVPKEHDPAHWEEHYRTQYGAAAPVVAHGRALLEKSKTLTDKEVSDGIEELVEAMVPGVAAVDPASDAARLLVMHTRMVGTRTVPDMTPPGASRTLRYHIASNELWWMRMASARLPLPKVSWDDSEPDRAYYDPDARTVRLDMGPETGTPIHEYAHAVEHIGRLAHLAHAFLAARTKGEELVRLCDLFPKAKYDPSEVTRKDKLWRAYMGKDYAPSGVHWAIDVTEVVSTLAGDVANGRLQEILQEDPESVLFLFGWLSGAR